MSWIYGLSIAVLLAILSVAAYIDRLYSEMGKFLARENQENLDIWQTAMEPRLRLARDSIAISASLLRQLSLAAVALLIGAHSFRNNGTTPHAAQMVQTAVELVLLILFFDWLLPQILFARTRGRWTVRIRPVLQGLFYVILPVTLLLGLLLSIVALAEPETPERTEDASAAGAMEALLEAGEEEGILEESDRDLVRSVVEFGDKVVREVMTPRPDVFAVPEYLTLQQFTSVIEEHAFSRVPVYGETLDDITGIAFAHDLLQISDTDAPTQRVAELQRPAAFVPETKNVAELLREMQREKQHMRIVIDEYGSVAGLVTIEDLLEAIVGEIADEHDDEDSEDAPVPEGDGSFLVPGTFEVFRLRDLFRDHDVYRPAAASSPTGSEPDEFDAASDPLPTREEIALPQPNAYEATTMGGLVTEIAGHIPTRGEVVEQDGLRMEVLASTDRRIDRLRVSLVTSSGDAATPDAAVRSQAS